VDASVVRREWSTELVGDDPSAREFRSVKDGAAKVPGIENVKPQELLHVR
jgi:hypothetical protein